MHAKAHHSVADLPRQREQILEVDTNVIRLKDTNQDYHFFFRRINFRYVREYDRCWSRSWVEIFK